MPQTQITKSVIIGNLPTGQNALSVFDTNFDQLFAALNAVTTFSMYVVDAGAANVYQASFAAGIVVSYFDGLGVDVKIANTNNGASTFNLNSLGAGNILLANGAALTGGELVAGSVVRLVRIGSNWFLSGGVISGGSVVNLPQLFRKSVGTGTTIAFQPSSSDGPPSWAREVTINFEGVSTNGGSTVILQLGTSGGFQNTGYNTSSGGVNSGGASGVSQATSGIQVTHNGISAAASIINGSITFTLSDTVNGVWCCAGAVGLSNAASGSFIGGSKSLAGLLDRLQATTVGGTDVFDGGFISARYKA